MTYMTFHSPEEQKTVLQSRHRLAFHRRPQILQTVGKNPLRVKQRKSINCCCMTRNNTGTNSHQMS